MSHQEFTKLLRSFPHAMLVTRSGTGLRSRPMAFAGISNSGKVWFLSHASSGKFDELSQHAEVNVACQHGQRFLSLSGTASRVMNPQKARELWSEEQRPWFPNGPDDPNLVIIQIEPDVAEYWDRSGFKGVEFALAEMRAVAGHGRLEENAAGSHDKLVF